MVGLGWWWWWWRWRWDWGGVDGWVGVCFSMDFLSLFFFLFLSSIIVVLYACAFLCFNHISSVFVCA